MALLISESLPITGSNFPSSANCVKSIVNFFNTSLSPSKSSVSTFAFFRDEWIFEVIFSKSYLEAINASLTKSFSKHDKSAASVATY